MNYLVFQTQAAAQIAANQIATNMGMPIASTNVQTGQPNMAVTQTTIWDTPVQILGASGTSGAAGYVVAHPLYGSYPNQWTIAAPASNYLTSVSGYTSVTQ